MAFGSTEDRFGELSGDGQAILPIRHVRANDPKRPNLPERDASERPLVRPVRSKRLSEAQEEEIAAKQRLRNAKRSETYALVCGVELNET